MIMSGILSKVFIAYFETPFYYYKEGKGFLVDL